MSRFPAQDFPISLRPISPKIGSFSSLYGVLLIEMSTHGENVMMWSGWVKLIVFIYCENDNMNPPPAESPINIKLVFKSIKDLYNSVIFSILSFTSCNGAKG